MNYSTCLLAFAASPVLEVETELNQTLQPNLQRITGLVTSFFGNRAVARRDPGL